MFAALFSIKGRLSPRAFLVRVLLTYGAGFILAWGLSYLLFGTLALPIRPLVVNPDALHVALYSLLPLLLSAPVFIRRLQDRDQKPILFMIYLGMTTGFALFVEQAPVAPDLSDLEAFVAYHAVHAPVSVIGLWLLWECLFLKGTKGPNRFGRDPLLGQELDGTDQQGGDAKVVAFHRTSTN
ncbi:MAG: DUF805 domain-containing protein [Pseudomonadota bacterium]